MDINSLRFSNKFGLTFHEYSVGIKSAGLIQLKLQSCENDFVALQGKKVLIDLCPSIRLTSDKRQGSSQEIHEE